MNKNVEQMKDFHAILNEKRSQVNRRLDELLSTTGFEQSEANELVKYTFQTGGKRLRPVLVLLACEGVGGKPEHAMDGAVAMEFLHAASLVFDDLIDRHRVRRSFPTTQRAFADDKAISAGLFLASKGVQILSEYKDQRITRLAGWGLVDLSKGEILDVTTEIAIDVEQYLAIADLKTGSLFSAASGIGGVLGDASAEEVDALYNYGRAIGIAFQIKDDILDQSNPERQERVNLVVMHYLDDATKKQRISNLLENQEGTVEKSVLYEKAMEFAIRKSREHVEKAKQELKGLRDRGKIKLLEDFADYALERTF
ncbi:MAG TPA: polyprenyl synthetase family protein [Candidatus Bathyarchaeia archaeon]|nr:polyprenyl synthetase family protein [Candidatus Bathyarchaeia archaeon]